MIIKSLGLQPYEQVIQQMQSFTSNRKDDTPDEIWLLEHPPVYTQGQAGKKEHLLNQGNIPLVQSDRGGQITYHGPGQLIAYFLLNINRRNLGIRTLVCKLEAVIINLLADYNITASTQCGAPGVYVNQKKIASIGLRIKNGCSYHGLALNIKMDLTPFHGINPCGYAQLEMTQMHDFDDTIRTDDVRLHLERKLIIEFGQ